MNIERAIAELFELNSEKQITGSTFAACVDALREKAEREGCVWCKEDNKVFHDGQHFHFFCSYCGKRLEVNNG